MHFPEWKCLNSDLNFTEVYYLGPTSDIPDLSDNGLAPTRRQAIICKKWWLDYRRICASLGLSEYTSIPLESLPSSYHPRVVFLKAFKRPCATGFYIRIFTIRTTSLFFRYRLLNYSVVSVRNGVSGSISFTLICSREDSLLAAFLAYVWPILTHNSS